MWVQIRKTDDDDEYSYWENESAAYADAVAQITNEIYYQFNLNDINQCLIAKEINDYIKSGNLKRAFKTWQAQGYLYSPLAFTIKEYIPKEDFDAMHPMIFDDSEFIALLPKQQDDSDKDDGKPFVATTSGATCRGPCKQHNEYAYADKKDNTYVCRQCKMMSEIFGGTIK